MDGGSDFERRLLGAMRDERPSPALRARMRRGLGLTGPLFWAASAKAMLGEVAGKGASAKLALGATAGVVVLAGGVAAVKLMSQAAPPPPPAPVEVRTNAPEAMPAAPSVMDLAPERPLPEPVGVEDAQRTTPPPAAAAESEASSTLREEIALLDAVRTALDGGDTARALTLLDAYRTRFPAGVLSREATVLRQRAAKPRGRAGNTAPR